MRHAIPIALGIAAIALTAVAANAAGGARNPFDDAPQNMALTKKLAACEADFQYRIGVIEKTYGPPMQKEKDTGARLNREIAVIHAQKVISAAVATVLKLKMKQLSQSQAEYIKLNNERLRKQTAAKQFRTDCINKAKTSK